MPNIIRKSSAMKGIDRTDCEILRHLSNDARMANSTLADQVGLAPSTCLGRVQSLRARGVLRGFYADICPETVGARLQAMIAVRLDRHAQAELERFRDEILAMPEVVQLYHVAGPTDFLVHVWVRDALHLRELAMRSFTTRPEVAHIETELIFEFARAQEPPLYVLDADDA